MVVAQRLALPALGGHRFCLGQKKLEATLREMPKKAEDSHLSSALFVRRILLNARLVD